MHDTAQLPPLPPPLTTEQIEGVRYLARKEALSAAELETLLRLAELGRYELTQDDLPFDLVHDQCVKYVRKVWEQLQRSFEAAIAKDEEEVVKSSFPERLLALRKDPVSIFQASGVDPSEIGTTDQQVHADVIRVARAHVQLARRELNSAYTSDLPRLLAAYSISDEEVGWDRRAWPIRSHTRVTMNLDGVDYFIKDSTAERIRAVLEEEGEHPDTD